MREFKCIKTVVMFNFLEVNNEGICSEQFILLLYRKQCLHKGKNIRFHMFFKVNVLKNLQNFTGKHQCWRLLLIKLWALRPGTLLKRPQQLILPLKPLRTPFLQNTSSGCFWKGSVKELP